MIDNTTPVTSRKTRKFLSKNEKLRIVEESHIPGTLLAEVARKHNVAVSSVVKWRKQSQQGSLMSLGSDENVISAKEAKEL